MRTTNSFGLSEKEVDTVSKSNIRILALGDSFTEGCGTDKETTFIKLTEAEYIKRGYEIETINAGIGGSDPVFEYKLFEDKLLIYQPDILILTINSSDIKDIMTRRGFDRFKANGTTGNPPPNWDWLYGSTYLARFTAHAILGYHRPFTNNKTITRQNALQVIESTLDMFKTLCEKENIKLLVVLQPSRHEVLKEEFLPYLGYNKIIAKLENENIKYFELSNNLLEEAKKSNADPKEYYWPIDTHFNSKGYEIFAKGVVSKLDELKWMSNSKTSLK